MAIGYSYTYISIAQINGLVNSFFFVMKKDTLNFGIRWRQCPLGRKKCQIWDSHIPLSYPLQAWFYHRLRSRRCICYVYARNFYYLLVLCSHPMKAVFAWVTVHYERLFSNSQSPMMDEEQVTSPISFWSFWTFSFFAKKWSAISEIR